MASPLCKFALTLLSVAMLGACTVSPAFQASLPASINTADQAIAVVGDLQQTAAIVRWFRQRENNAAEQQMLVADLRARLPELSALVITGDLVYSARSTNDWNRLDSLIAEFADQIPILPAPGNHDYPCFLVQICRTSKMAPAMAARFPWLQPGQPYSVPAGQLVLLFLDSESRIEQQSKWLEAQLREATDHFSGALVFFHRPAYTNSIDFGAKGNADVQQFVVPVLNSASIPVVAISGHIHGYEHIIRDGVNYVTSAGGGGPRGPLAAEPDFDAWRGPDCVQDNGNVLRPFNYLLLRPKTNAVLIEVHGFCRGDPQIRLLDTVELAL